MNRLFVRIWGASLSIVILATVLSHLGFVLATRAQLAIESDDYINTLIEIEKKVLFQAKAYGIEEALFYIQGLDKTMQTQIAIYNDQNFDITSGLGSHRQLWTITSRSEALNAAKKDYKTEFYDRWGEHFIMEINTLVILPIWFSPSLAGYILRFSASLLLCGLAAFFLARNMSQPILMITSKLREVKNGALHSRINEHITNRKDEVGQLARNFNQMTESMLTMRNNETRLLSDVAHDIRSPLSRQKLALSFLEKKEIQNNPIKLNEYIERSQIENERLNELINDLLLYFRSENFHTSNHTTISLSQILTEVVEDASFEFSVQNKYIECDLKENVSVFGLYSKLIRAFENVVRNAMFHTNEGTTVAIKINTTQTHVIVDIIDQGSGVEEHQIPFLTQAFFRTDSARNLARGGYGLGLPICQSIINQHGGTLAIANIKPAGLKVTITLNKA